MGAPNLAVPPRGAALAVLALLLVVPTMADRCVSEGCLLVPCRWLRWLTRLRGRGAVMVVRSALRRSREACCPIAIVHVFLRLLYSGASVELTVSGDCRTLKQTTARCGDCTQWNTSTSTPASAASHA
jgi:hypothetical protein